VAVSTPIAKTATALAEALGFHKSRISQLRKMPWFPDPGPDGWEVDRVRAAIAANVKGRRGKGKPGPRRGQPAPPPAPPPPAWLAGPTPGEPLDPREAELVRVLEEGDDPAQLAKAAAQAAARDLAAVRAGERDAGARDIESLAKALSELRQTERALLDLRQRRGELIERTVARATAGAIALKFTRALANLEAMLSTQVEVWLADPAWRDGAADIRRREIRNWVQDQARELRELVADDIDEAAEQLESGQQVELTGPDSAIERLLAEKVAEHTS